MSKGVYYPARACLHDLFLPSPSSLRWPMHPWLTLVFRDGHRVEVPPVFTLTTTTLTYEAAPGINRTVQLILVDVAATERAKP